MSWLARSLVNSLRANDTDSDDESSEPTTADSADPDSPTRGVKEDLSELTQTLTRQFWGVASFLAPPPEPSPNDAEESPDAAESPRFAAIRSDFAEIGGRVRSGISLLSSNKAVSEISKMASTLFGSEEGDDEEEGRVEAVGVTEEVKEFVRNISMHPETWLDFPLLAEYDDSYDFHMSDAQQEHALDVEHLVPRLAALRIELCPSHMNESCFWKIYFVLLHPRLSKQDADLLSTPQIVQARAMLLQDLQNRTQRNSKSSDMDLSHSTEEGAILVASGVDPVTPSITPLTEESKAKPSITPLTEESKAKPSITPLTEESKATLPSPEFETDKHPIQTTVVKVIEKSVIEEEPTTHAKKKDILTVASNDEDDGDEWLQDETGETSLSGSNAVPLGDDEDVSFSDLEADDDEGLQSSRAKRLSIGSSTKKEGGWVELDKGSDGVARSGLNDWLDVDIDV